ncbi:hypothetical protein JZU48_00290 [bacterium]|jgi:hypothetical protein|nr:hypothetical protein [bacterium]
MTNAELRSLSPVAEWHRVAAGDLPPTGVPVLGLFDDDLPSIPDMMVCCWWSDDGEWTDVIQEELERSPLQWTPLPRYPTTERAA